MTELEQYLDVAGFQPRRAQTDLYDHLISTDRRGVIAQAGTGTGKSAAVIAAAAHMARMGTQSIIVTPTLTLMNQYRDGDLPIAKDAYPDLVFAELRGRAHYFCGLTQATEGPFSDYEVGCAGSDGGCSLSAWRGCSPELCGLCLQVGAHDTAYICDYQAAKVRARDADVVVTNADMLIVNDRILAELEANIFQLDGSLFVDEAHTLEQKIRDWASRQLHWSTVGKFKFTPGGANERLAKWLRRQEGDFLLSAAKGFPLEDLRAIAEAHIPDPQPKDGLAQSRTTQEACARILEYMEDPHDHAVLHVAFGALKFDWVNVSKSAGELLTQRAFGLVSATVPRTMAATLGITGAPFIDVGHPFDYGTQCWIGFSSYGGDYKSAQHTANLDYRIAEVKALLERAKGGALVLFSSFRDLEIVSEALRPWLLNELGVNVLIQERDMSPAERQKLADDFKADGNAVLFGSESFATGFDVPGDALRLVVIWKLPYPAVDPVSNAIRAQSYQRYEDIMKVRAVQAVGRLIRRESDRGIVWFADNRGRRLLDANDPLTSHIPQFARLP